MSQLHKIADATGEKRANVVLIHGLGGHHLDTWRHGLDDATLWPKWLTADVPGLTVYSLGYEAAISRWSGTAMHLPDRARNVLAQLLGNDELTRWPLYLIGHSMGGLVIKHLLRTADSEARHRSEPAELLARVEKVAFLATPHTGASQATLGDWLRVFAKPSEATACLIRNDPSLRDLNLWYRGWAKARGIPHLILNETQPTWILGKLVQPDSGDPGLGENPIPLDATHSTISKPLDRTQQAYIEIRKFIASAARPHSDPIVAKIESLPDEIVDKLVERLDARGQVQKAQSGGLERQAIVDLARRLKPDETLDFDQAIKELENAVTIALDVVAKAKRGTNQDDLVNDALARSAEKTKTGQFDQAARELDLALVELDRRAMVQREEMRLSSIALLEAGIGQDILRRDPESVARRIEQIVAIRHPDDAGARFEALRESHDTYYVEGRDRGINFSLEIAIEVAQQTVSAAFDVDRRVIALNCLGNALMELGERESGTGRIEDAVTAYRKARGECARERVPLGWAGIQNNLGNALRIIGERQSGTARLDEAVIVLREALQEYTRELVPLDWAMTQNNLGLALWALGKREKGLARFEDAVMAFREALKENTRERSPLQWAALQNNLGAALQSLAEREGGTARLEEAIVAFREALSEWSRERMPLDWAMTNHNLATVLSLLGRHESGTQRLEESVEAYHQALKEWTHDRARLQWGTSYGNQGVALMFLAERRSDAGLAKQAVGQIETALATMQEGGHVPFAAYYEERLPAARALRDRLTKG